MRQRTPIFSVLLSTHVRGEEARDPIHRLHPPRTQLAPHASLSPFHIFPLFSFLLLPLRPMGTAPLCRLIRPLLLCGLAVQAHLLSTCSARPAHTLRAQPASASGRRLTARISRTATAAEVLSLHAKAGTSFNAIHLATCWAVLARVSKDRERLIWHADSAQLASLRNQTVARLPSLDSRSIASTAHALAKLGLCGPEWDVLWDPLREAALSHVKGFAAQGLAMTAYAFAKRGQPAADLFGAIAKEAITRIDEFKPQELANVAWSFATLRFEAPELFDALSLSLIHI